MKSSPKAVSIIVDEIILNMRGQRSGGTTNNKTYARTVIESDGRHLAISSGTLKYYLLKNEHPRAHNRGEAKKYSAHVTTDIFTALCAGHMISPDQNIKRSSIYWVEEAVCASLYISNTKKISRSVPTKENGEFDDNGVFFAKAGVDFAEKEIATRNNLRTSMAINLETARMAKHDDLTGDRSFMGMIDGVDLSLSSSLSKISETLTSRAIKSGFPLQEGDITFGQYERVGSERIISEKGVFFSDNVVILMVKELVKKMGKLYFQDSGGTVETVSIGQITIRLDDGSVVVVNSPGELIVKLREIGISQFYAPSDKESIKSAYSKELSEENKAARKVEEAAKKAKEKEKAAKK